MALDTSVFDQDDRRQLKDFLEERRSLEHLLPAVERVLTQELSGLENHGCLSGASALDWALVIELIFKHSRWSVGIQTRSKLNSRTACSICATKIHKTAYGKW